MIKIGVYLFHFQRNCFRLVLHLTFKYPLIDHQYENKSSRYIHTQSCKNIYVGKIALTLGSQVGLVEHFESPQFLFIICQMDPNDEILAWVDIPDHGPLWRKLMLLLQYEFVFQKDMFPRLRIKGIIFQVIGD